MIDDDRRSRTRPTAGEQRLLLKCALWLHMGYIGAVTIVAGLIQLSGNDVRRWPALALIFCGGLLSLSSLRHARNLLDDAGDGPSVRGVPVIAGQRPGYPSAMDVAGRRAA